MELSLGQCYDYFLLFLGCADPVWCAVYRYNQHEYNNNPCVVRVLLLQDLLLALPPYASGLSTFVDILDNTPAKLITTQQRAT
jgi:hypothetical protein